MGILLQPFMPERMKAALDMIGVDDSRRTIEYARLGADLDYGTVDSTSDGGYRTALFPQLLSSF
jgi:methionyl-tRNA synthetase